MYKFRVERQRNLGLSPRVMVLSRSDSVDFVETLNNPPEPNEALKEAAKRYKDMIDSGKLIVEDRGLDFDVQSTYNIQGQALKNRLEE